MDRNKDDEESIQQGSRIFTNRRNFRVLMITHSKLFERVMIYCIVIHIHVVLIMFTNHKVVSNFHADILHYGFETIYFLYIGMHIIHRNWSIHAHDYCNNAIPFILISLGTITLFPIYEVYAFLIVLDQHLPVEHMMRLKVIIRLLHIMEYFTRRRHECGTNRTLILFSQSITVISLYTCMASSILQILGCYNCELDNWTTHLKDAYYDPKNLIHRIFFPVFVTGGVLLGNYSDTIMAETMYENLLILTIMLSGIILRSNFLMAQLINHYITMYRQRSSYTRRLYKIYNFIASNDLSKEIQNEIREYYNILWTNRRGIFAVNTSFLKLLPPSIQYEIQLDLCWDVVAHSHFFREQPMSVKRQIAMLTKCHFMLKGDTVYDCGDFKNKLIYIVSGVVQLLSDEDDESPIVSLSSGTIISEIGCLILTKSESKLRCATYCEFRVLHMTELYRGMRYNRADVRKFQAIFQNRITLAKRLQSLQKSISHKSISRPIQRVKIQWHGIAINQPITNRAHTSMHLDLLALSDEMGLKVEVICLTSKFPLIMDPNSSFHNFCDIIVLISTLIASLIIPYCAAFERALTTEMRTFLMFLDFIYWLDIYIQLTTAIKEDDFIIVKFRDILIKRAKQVRFLIDVAAGIPLDYVFWAKGSDAHAYILLKTPRVIKIYKCIGLVRKFEKQMLNMNVSLELIIKYYCMWIIGAYFYTCILYITSCFHATCIAISWYPYFIELAYDNNPVLAPFQYSLLAVINVLAGGSRLVYTHMVTDGILTLVIVICGYYLYGFCISEIAAIKYWNLHESVSYNIFITTVTVYMRLNKIETQFVNRMIDLLNFRWRLTNGLYVRSATELFNELPWKLQDRVREEMIGKFLEMVPLFQNMHDENRRHVIQMAQLISYSAGAFITIQDDIVRNIYIIRRGYCRIISRLVADEERKTHIKYITTGACFPVIEVIHGMPNFVTVIAETAVDAVVIPYTNFMHVARTNRAYYRILKNTMRWHRQYNKLELSRTLNEQEFELQNKVNANKPKYFKYEINDQLVEHEAPVYFFQRTIDPHSTTYIIYEIFRCITIVVQFIILMLQFTILFDYRYFIYYMHIVCDILSWIDIYIRMHVQYHTETGILVTYYKSTTRYYMEHSFVLDFYASCLFSTLSIDTIISIESAAVIKQIILLLSRPFQLYRIFYGLSYLFVEKKWVSEVNATRILYIFAICVITPLLGNLIMLSVCDVDWDLLRCPLEGWQGGTIRNISNYNAAILYTYLSLLYLTGTPKNNYAPESTSTFILYIVFTIMSLVFIWLIMSNLISTELHGEYKSYQLQNNRFNFKRFGQIESVNNVLVSRLLKLDEYLTRDTKSSAIIDAQKHLTPHLFRELAFISYEDPMNRCQLFYDAPEQSKRSLAFSFRKCYFMKDDAVIRTNDINSDIFIVKSGRVAITIAGMRMTELGCGGMFGCFASLGRTRQTINAIVMMHTEIMAISTIDCIRNIRTIDNIRKRMRQYIRRNAEYVEEVTKSDQEIVATVVQDVNRFWRIYNSINRALDRHRPRILIFEYIMNVHVCSLNTMFILLYHLVTIHEDGGWLYLLILYLLDILFFVKMFINCTFSYVDQKFGLLVTDGKKIIIRYLKNDFTLDVISTLMFELWFGHFFKKQFHRALLSSNRILRVLCLIRYYNAARRQNKLTHHLRWTFLIYIIPLYIIFATNVWSFVACPGICLYREFISYRSELYIYRVSYVLSYMSSYSYVLSCFASNGMQDMKPITINEVIVTIAIILTSLYMKTCVTGRYAFIQQIDNYNYGQYTYNLNELQQYLEILRLSPAILKKSLNYYHFLWTLQNGEQWPALMQQTNRYIREDIMLDMFSSMLTKHLIFQNCHQDFIRQLVVHMRRYVYPSSMIIVEERVIDGMLYFIQSGEVTVTHGSKLIDTLTRDQSFGELSGLTMAPHEYTYIANTLVVVLSLNITDWRYLLEFYPATLEEIRNSLRKNFDALFTNDL